jgi:hypothetical protein
MLMLRRLIGWLLATPCLHQFSWPQVGSDGHVYQACTRCGQLFLYDWSGQRPLTPAESAAQNLPKGWRPRALRFETRIPASYRDVQGERWAGGIVRNVSESGVLLSGPLEIGEGALVEMNFEMPEFISGIAGAEAHCTGRVMRVERGSLAVALIKCMYVTQPKRAAR